MQGCTATAPAPETSRRASMLLRASSASACRREDLDCIPLESPVLASAPIFAVAARPAKPGPCGISPSGGGAQLQQSASQPSYGLSTRVDEQNRDEAPTSAQGVTRSLLLQREPTVHSLRRQQTDLYTLPVVPMRQTVVGSGAFSATRTKRKSLSV